VYVTLDGMRESKRVDSQHLSLGIALTSDIDRVAEELGLTRSALVRTLIRSGLRSGFDYKDLVFWEVLNVFVLLVGSAVSDKILDSDAGDSLLREIADARALVGARVRDAVLERAPGVTFNEHGRLRLPKPEGLSQEEKDAGSAEGVRVILADSDTEVLRVFERAFSESRSGSLIASASADSADSADSAELAESA